MKYLLTATAASALIAGTAFAGNIEPAPMEPIIAPAPAPMSSSPDWTGFYVGGELGYADLGVSGNGIYNDYNPDDKFLGINRNSVGDGFIGGVVLGYDYDVGNWVVGAGADYDWTDISVRTNRVYTIGGGEVNFDTKLESIWRIKARGGYKIGNGLLYATAGYAQADTKDFGSADGWLVGAGYEHLVGENFSLGLEVLYHEFDNFKRDRGDGFGVKNLDLDATTVQLRGTYRF